jgi:hypothetical protein
VSLKDMHIVSDPLLYKGCHKCSGKAENKGHKPKGIHTDIGWGWVESRKRGRRSRRDDDLRDYRGDLLRDLGKNRNILLQVVHRLICWTRCQTLFDVDYECSESRRK